MDSSTASQPSGLHRLLDPKDGAASQVFTHVYEELHRLAEQFMGEERNDHTLQPTALVHEAYVKLFNREDPRWDSREHFLGMAAQAMRFVLVDHARARAAKKRGGDQTKIVLDEAVEQYEERAVDLLILDEGLQAMEELDPQLAKIVELRFFGGMTIAETAKALDISPRTVDRGWWTARAWLRQEMGLGVPRGDD